MTEATVIEFRRAEDYVGWWQLRYKFTVESAGERTGLVHHNWVNCYGELMPGEKIDVTLSKAPLYSGCPHDFFDVLERTKTGDVQV